MFKQKILKINSNNNNKNTINNSIINSEIDKKTDDKSPLIQKPNKNIKLNDSILVKTLSFGLNGFFWAAYSTANSKLITMLNNEESGASTLVSAYRSVIFGSFTGLLLSTGLEIAPYLSENNENYIEAGNMAKTAWALTIVSGAISSIGMLSTNFLFPFLFEQNTAKAGADFFSGCAIGTIPMLMVGTNVQIAFQAGEWFVPPIATFLVFASALLLSYLFAFDAKLGAFGVGLGGSIAQWVICIIMQAWFLRPFYKKYDLYQFHNITGFKNKIKKLLRSGWKLSLQRMTEWVNLMLIATIIGQKSNDALKATNPSAQYLNLLATFLQGVAQAAGMVIKRNNKSLNFALHNFNEQEARKWHQDNIKTFIQSNMAVLLISLIIAGLFYFGRQPLTSFFLANNVDSSIQELGEILLIINMIGLIFDAVRIVSAGALRGWETFIYPTMVSLIVVTILGIPLGWGLSEFFQNIDAYQNEAAWMFYLRSTSMLAAAVTIGFHCFRQISLDNVKISSHFKKYLSEKENLNSLDNTNSLTTIPTIGGKTGIFSSDSPSSVNTVGTDPTEASFLGFGSIVTA